MRHSNLKQRQDNFNLVRNYEDMEKNRRVFFPNEQPYFDLIDYFEGEYLLERALDVVGHAIHQFGHTAEFLVAKAGLLLKNKEAEQALAILDKAAALSPADLEIQMLKAEGFAALDLHEEALELLEALKSHANAEEMSKIFVNEAHLYEQLKDYERMFFALTHSLEENPNNNDALSLMWYCVEHARRYEESVALHERILEDNPFSALAWYNLGAAHHYLCNHQEAIEAYEYAYLTNEEFEFAYRDCAEVCLSVNDYQKALQCYQEVLERFEPEADVFMHIGQCYFGLGNYLVAKTFYEKAVGFDAWCDEAHFRIGQCYAKQKNWQKAISAFLKAIRIEDNQEEYHLALGEAYSQVGDYKKAERFYRSAADTGPDEATCWIRLSQFLLDRGRFDEAEETLEEAEDYCFGPDLLYFRAALLFAMERKKEAMLALEDALQEDYDAYKCLFVMMPAMEHDREVKAVISVFQPEEDR